VMLLCLWASRCCYSCVAHAFNLSFAPDDIALMFALPVCIWVGHKSLLVLFTFLPNTMSLAAQGCTNPGYEYKCIVLLSSHSLHMIRP
jgi:hypothetical protein